MRIAIKRTILFLVGLILLAGLFAMPPVWSMEIRTGEVVVISANEIIDDDLYLAGNTITIDGVVKGDVIAAGRLITINGTVAEDLLAAGQAVVINGNINDDVRIVGQALQIGENARIADDLVAAGFSLESKPNSVVGGRLTFAGMQSLLAGDVKQDVNAAAAALELRGTVGRDVNVTVGVEGDESEPFYPPFFPQPPVTIPQLRPGLTVADSAKIGGQLRYQATTDANIRPGAEVERQIREKIRAEQRPNLAVIFLNSVRRFITLFLVGILLLWAVPNWTQGLANRVQSQPWLSLAWGVVAWLLVAVSVFVIGFATFLLTVIFGLTIFGLVPLVLGLGLLAIFVLSVSFLLFIGYIPQVIISFLTGRWLLQNSRANWSSGRFIPLAVGLVIFIILTAIPVLGALINLVVILLGLGALWFWGRTKISPVRDSG